MTAICKEGRREALFSGGMDGKAPNSLLANTIHVYHNL
jgi:hypothetical protein